MGVISTRIHGVLDYLTAAALIVLPLLLLFGAGGGGEAAGAAARDPYTTAGWFLVGPGLALLGLSLLTRYELGAVRAVPMPAHLWTDAGLGVFLILAPWVFGFAAAIWWPHVLAGVAEIGAALLTRRRSPVEAPRHEAAGTVRPGATR